MSHESWVVSGEELVVDDVGVDRKWICMDKEGIV